MIDQTSKIKLFISYCHDDLDYFKVFNKGLKKVIKNAEHFDWSTWDDNDIYVGTFWDDEIQYNIDNSNVAMLLVSLGFMASKYIREKEFNEFIKRYKEKGILIVPVMFAPCNFNRWEDLAMLQFFKPKGFVYGKPEIEDFTYADLIEFKKTDGILIPNPNIDRYHLDVVKKVEESFKEFTDTKETVAVQQKILNTNFNKFSDYPKPNNLFTGRKTEIGEFRKEFNSFRVIVIEGLGGTGKTQFAAKCIEEAITNKNRIIWLNGSAQSSFNVFVEGAGYGDVLKGEKKTDVTLYSGLKDLIEKDRRIIFWDNYNEYEDSAFSKFLSFAHQYLQKATIVLITKTEPSIEGVVSFPIIRLGGLNDDAIDYAKKLKASNPRYNSILDSDLEQICIRVEGHPLAIELSMLLLGYGKSVNEIMLQMPQLSGMKKVEEFSKRLFFDILNHSDTSAEERNFFLMCSVFKEKIKGDEIKFLYDGNDPFSLLAGLIDKLLITFKDGFYEIHPLVRSFSYEKLANKEPIHKKAAEYFISLRNQRLDPLLEEKIFYHLLEAKDFEFATDSIIAIGRKFIKQGQLGLLYDLVTKLINAKVSCPVFDILLGDIAQIKGEWAEAINYFQTASSNELEKDIKAEGMVKYGEILFRRGDIKESLPFFLQACEFSKSNSFSKMEARALNDIGLVYDNFNELNISYQQHSASLKIREQIDDLEGIATSYNNLGNIFGRQKRYNKALIFYNKSIKIAEETGQKNELALYLVNIGEIYRQQEKFADALLKLEEALKISKEIGDKQIIGESLNVIGVIYLNQGKLTEALTILEESLEVRKEIGDKRGIAITYNNLGSYYLNYDNYPLSLSYFFKSLDLNIKMGSKADEDIVVDWFAVVREKMGQEGFKKLSTQVYDELDFEIKQNIDLSRFLKETNVSFFPNAGRNNPCPCGSGKKYKKCHGKNAT